MVDDDQALIWRGPMATQALEQLLRQTRWQDLDYLIIDMPPAPATSPSRSRSACRHRGRHRHHPQDIALIDAKKGLKMFEKVGIPSLGVVENMAVHICSHCGHAEHIFGSEGAARMAAQYGLELLASLPWP